MSWIGAGIGAIFGSRNGSVLGGIIGAVIGNWLEGKVRAAVSSGAFSGSSNESGDAEEGELTVLAAISAMMAKMAKADGIVTAEEVRYCEGVFDRLGLKGEKREYCIRVFRMAKTDGHSIYEYAESFAEAQSDRNMREIVYDILWDIACADGIVSPEELVILKSITRYLKINAANFAWQSSQRGVNSGRNDETRSGVTDPYEILGVKRSASNDEVKAAYRAKAKALHPDVLKANGLSDELIGKANEQMAKVNAAWSEIRRERGL